MNKYAALTPELLRIIRDKGTEPAFSGDYLEVDSDAHGSYLCRGCGHALFRAQAQFTSQCGWPSFDNEIAEAVTTQHDSNNRGQEIICARCTGHLGHLFYGEKFTARNTRHCVNSLSVEFVKDEQVIDSEEIIIAAGCFWGVQALFDRLDGVLKTQVGYIGGSQQSPDYKQVCHNNSGHFEAVRVLFNPKSSTLSDILRYFFEIHDFSQTDGQGPDLGAQYLSAIFYFNLEQKRIAEQLIENLVQQGYGVATTLHKMATFWVAENYHQNYYTKQGSEPYCHVRKAIFKR